MGPPLQLFYGLLPFAYDLFLRTAPPPGSRNYTP